MHAMPLDAVVLFDWLRWCMAVKFEPLTQSSTLKRCMVSVRSRAREAFGPLLRTSHWVTQMDTHWASHGPPLKICLGRHFRLPHSILSSHVAAVAIYFQIMKKSNG